MAVSNDGSESVKIVWLLRKVYGHIQDRIDRSLDDRYPLFNIQAYLAIFVAKMMQVF